MAQVTGRSNFEVSGLLLALWGWFSLESRDGHVQSVTIESLPATLGGDKKFWKAVADVGWLLEARGGLQVPNWDHWLSKSAKKRLKALQRKQRQREAEEAVEGHPPARPDLVTQLSRSERDRTRTQTALDEDEEIKRDGDEEDRSKAPAVVSSQDCLLQGGEGRTYLPSPPSIDAELVEQIVTQLGVGYPRATQAVEELGVTRADWVDWLRFKAQKGVRLTIHYLKRHRNPRDIPGDQEATRKPTLAEELSQAVVHGPDATSGGKTQQRAVQAP